MQPKELLDNLNTADRLVRRRINGPLRNVRVVKKNLVYIIGLHPDHVASKSLDQAQGLGRYGEVKKLIFNPEKTAIRDGQEQVLYSAYVTFAEEAAAALAIVALSGYEYRGLQIKANFGMTKYCTYFIKGVECPNSDCLFLHSLAQPSECHSKVQ